MSLVKGFCYIFDAMSIEGVFLDVVTLDIQHTAFVLSVMAFHRANKTIGH